MLDIILKALKVFDKKTSVKATTELANDNANDNVKLGENQKVILEMLAENKFMTQADIAKELGITTANVNRNIKKLKDLGLLKWEGSDKSGCWAVKS